MNKLAQNSKESAMDGFVTSFFFFVALELEVADRSGAGGINWESS